jgi:hypothetical protein
MSRGFGQVVKSESDNGSGVGMGDDSIRAISRVGADLARRVGLAALPPSVTPGKLARFLGELRSRPGFARAARSAGLSASALHRLRSDSPFFDEAVRLAMIECGETLEAAAYERALSKSDTLAAFMLKGLYPDRYGDRVRVENRSQVEIIVDLTNK